MENNNILDFLTNEALSIMERTFSNEEINKAFETQLQITHVIPIRHRVLGGLYQSANIKFGNFLEILMKKIINDDSRYTLVKKITTDMPVDNNEFIKKNKITGFPLINTVEGGKSTMFIISKRNQKLIDDYITECTKADADKTKIKINFDKLISDLTKNIIEEKENPLIYDYLTFKNDVDLLFFKNENNNYFYVELKKEDNHDSDKTKAMYQKVIKTFTCLMYQAYSNEDKTLTINSLTPILLFFGDINNPSNILPEDAVFSGKDFFDKYLTIDFSEINNNMCKVSNSEKITQFLDNKILEILSYPNKELLKLLENIINNNIEKDTEIKLYTKNLQIYNNILDKINLFKLSFTKKDKSAVLSQIKKNKELELKKDEIEIALDNSINTGVLDKKIEDLHLTIQNKINFLTTEKEAKIILLKKELENKFCKNIIEEIAI